LKGKNLIFKVADEEEVMKGKLALNTI